MNQQVWAAAIYCEVIMSYDNMSLAVTSHGYQKSVTNTRHEDNCRWDDVTTALSYKRY